jgi:hypothetical protein
VNRRGAGSSAPSLPRSTQARRALVAALAAVAASGVASRAEADEFAWDASFRVESDLRFRLESRAVSDVYASKSLVAGVERNQNLLGVRLEAGIGDVKAVAQIDGVIFGYQTEIENIGLLTRPEETQPWRLDINELYIDVRKFVFDGLDVRLGQQIVAFGVGDQFNPTNNLNPDDLRDPLLFGRLAGNFMARADYWVSEDFRLTGVLVPLFRPAMLPPSASLGPAAIDRLPFLDESVRWRVASERYAAESALARHPTQIDGLASCCRRRRSRTCRPPSGSRAPSPSKTSRSPTTWVGTTSRCRSPTPHARCLAPSAACPASVSSAPTAGCSPT